MKKTLVALAMAGAFAGSASAQSNVTFYGVIDVALHELHLKNAGSELEMDEGAFQGSRIGFKGSEDLGGSTKAVFDLENGFQLWNGGFDQQGQLFGRQAWAGISDNWGELTFGRQYGVSFDVTGDFDPYGWGNYGSDNLTNAWGLLFTGLRFDNTALYQGKFGPVNILAQHSFGGQAGSSQAGSTNGLGGNFTGGPVEVGVSWESTDDLQKNKSTNYNLGAALTFSPLVIQALFVDLKTDPGFDVAGGITPGTFLNHIPGNTLTTRTDKYYSLAGTFNFTPADQIILNWFYDKTTNVTDAAPSGSMATYGLVYDHNLSKRTDLYVTFYDTKAKNGDVGSALAGMIGFDTGAGAKSSGTDIGLGFRHKF